MKTAAAWLIVANALAGLPVTAAKTDPAIHACPDPCIDVGEGTNAEYKECFSQWLDREKRLLDERLARALAEFKERQSVAKAIKAAHDAWESYRDAQCKAAGLRYEGGSMQRTVTLACLARTTCARVTDLEGDFLWSND